MAKGKPVMKYSRMLLYVTYSRRPHGRAAATSDPGGHICITDTLQSIGLLAAQCLHIVLLDFESRSSPTINFVLCLCPGRLFTSSDFIRRTCSWTSSNYLFVKSSIMPSPTLVLYITLITLNCPFSSAYNPIVTITCHISAS